MKNFVQAGRTVTVPAPVGGAYSGSPILVGSIFGVANHTAPPAANVEIDVVGVFDLPKASGLSFAVGDAVYFDATNKVVTSAASGNHLIGSALSVAGGSDSSVRVRLAGMVVT